MDKRLKLVDHALELLCSQISGAEAVQRLNNASSIIDELRWFCQFFLEVMDDGIYSAWGEMCETGAVGLDEVLTYEHLARELCAILKRNGTTVAEKSLEKLPQDHIDCDYLFEGEEGPFERWKRQQVEVGKKRPLGDE